MKYLIWLSNNYTSVREIVSSLRSYDVEVELLLIQDGVYLADKGCSASNELKELKLNIHALKHHVEERGITERLAFDVNLIDYPEVINILMEKADKVISL